MSNSSLATYSHITSKCNPRNKAISKITIHHMAGVMTGKECADYFCKTDRQVSANYCIGYDGDIALNVPENMRPWTSSSAANDHQAITIEVSNSSKNGDWPISQKAMNALIDLCTDIIKRNPGIGKLTYNGTTSGSLTLHEMFANTNCPGPYVKKNLAYICNQVNSRVFGSTSTSKPTSSATCPYPEPTVVLSKSNAAAGKKYGGTSQVKWVHWYLTKLNYYGGDIDGYFGPMTESAVKAFQKAHKDANGTQLTADGSVGPLTRGAFKLAVNKKKATNPYKKPTMVLNSKNAAYGKQYGGTSYVKYVHWSLKQLGYYAGEVDGYFGPKTVSAVKNFQKSHKDKNGKQLAADGSVGPLTLDAMERAIS